MGRVEGEEGGWTRRLRGGGGGMVEECDEYRLSSKIWERPR
jgi:hypothetical protein